MALDRRRSVRQLRIRAFLDRIEEGTPVDLAEFRQLCDDELAAAVADALSVLDETSRIDREALVHALWCLRSRLTACCMPWRQASGA